MKILLINPPLIDHSMYEKPPLISACPGTGLSYLYSYLKKENYNCKIYDFYFDNWDYIERILIEENADIIGITCLTEGRFNAFKLLSLIRKVKNDTLVIFGGHHPTYMCDQLLNNFDIDYIVLGEGEIKLLNLIRAIEGKIPLETVLGIAYKRNGEIIKNISKKKDYIKDLDALPFPFSEDQMHIFKKYPLLKDLHPGYIKLLSRSTFDKIRIVSIVTSRGCPFNCQFCSSTLFWGIKWRFRTPKNVVDEIEFYYKKLGFIYVNFADDAFTINPERTIKICKEIIRRKLKIWFDCTTRADSVRDELVVWLKKAGCVSVALGVESGSAKIRKTINKNLSYKSVINAFNILKKHKIFAYPLLMVGNPGETNETIKKTISLLKIIKPRGLGVSITMVFCGTELYNLAKDQGFINDDFWLENKPPPYYTYENPLRTLKKWVSEVANANREIKRYKLKILVQLQKFSKINGKINSLIIKKLSIRSKNIMYTNPILTIIKAKIRNISRLSFFSFEKKSLEKKAIN